ncbi:MAG: hypothetical protein ABSE68_02225 [Minisyncoccia bacterium]
MANLIPVDFFCQDCKQPVGISIKLIEACLANEYAKESESLKEDISETEIETFQMAEGVAAPFTKIPTSIDPVTKTFCFPLWCDNCNCVKIVTISAGEIQEISQTHKNSGSPEMN